MLTIKTPELRTDKCLFIKILLRPVILVRDLKVEERITVFRGHGAHI